MHFGVALDLGGLHYLLPAHAPLRIVGVHRVAAQGGVREHQALGDVGVVRDGQKAGAGAGAGLLQPAPQVVGIGAVDGGEGLEGAGLDGVGVRHHHSMQVGAARHGAPLPAQQRGEAARFVVGLGGGDDLAPSGAHHLRWGGEPAGGVGAPAGGRRARVCGLRQHVPKQRRPGAFVNGVADGAGGVPVVDAVQKAGVVVLQAVAVDVAQDAGVLRMVGDDQKVQRRTELHPRPMVRMDHRRPLGEAVGGVRVRGEVVVEEGVEGVGGVQVGVPPQQLFLRRRRQRQGRRQHRRGPSPARRPAAKPRPADAFA